jgi:hypothetical protein
MKTLWIGALLGASAMTMMAGPALAESFEERSVEVTGVADASDGNVAAARQRALADGLRNAVQAALGTLVESRFDAEQRETLRDGKSDLYSSIADRVRTRSEGYVSGHTVLSERQDGALYSMRLRVRVRDRALAAELAELEALMQSQGRPKAMVLVTESFEAASGEVSWLDRPSLSHHVEGALMKRGFPMVTGDSALRPDDLRSAFGDAALAARLAGGVGAEIAIVGTAEVRQVAADAFGTGMLIVTAAVRLRAVEVSSGAVLSSRETVARATGATPDSARQKAVQAGAGKAVDALLGQVVASWRRDAREGKSYLVELGGIDSYGKQARPFLTRVRSIAGVQAVEQRGFADRRLRIEVRFEGSRETFLDRLFETLGADPDFAGSDLAAGSGDRIELVL